MFCHLKVSYSGEEAVQLDTLQNAGILRVIGFYLIHTEVSGTKMFLRLTTFTIYSDTILKHGRNCPGRRFDDVCFGFVFLRGLFFG